MLRNLFRLVEQNVFWCLDPEVISPEREEEREEEVKLAKQPWGLDLMVMERSWIKGKKLTS